MSDTSGSPLIPPRDSRLTPDAVAERGFSHAKRGYAESEVRTFLRMVADELATLAGRERDLANRVRSLEERLSAPTPPPSDQDLIAALGEETARVLVQARESAAELRTKAEEHARRVVREAQENARELRASTQQLVETKSREAEEAARARAKEIVGEARTMRERVLNDLTERRGELERQVNELRSGRTRLVETYQAVERALVQATRLMAEEPPVPSSSAPSSALPTPTPVDEPPPDDRAPDDRAPDDRAPDVPSAALPPAAPLPALPAVAPDAPNAPGATSATSATSARAPAATPAADAPGRDTPDPPGAASIEARDVGALFEQLRSGRQEAPQEPATAESAAEPAVSQEDVTEPVGSAAPTGDESKHEPVDADDPAGPEPEPEAEPEPASAPAGAALLKARDDALARVAEDLGRRAKRTLQDEQNDVLDGLRRQRGKIDTTKILPVADEQVSRWAHVLQPAVDRAYAEGAGTVADGASAAATSAPGALLTELARGAVEPLRGRLEDSLASVDTRSPADTELAVAQALGARYREWRTQDLDTVLGDALAAAYARGVFDAAPEGARLRWVAAREGKCPDCDDNALEPTVRGSDFPTGQAFPPAHPGCRCLIVIQAPES